MMASKAENLYGSPAQIRVVDFSALSIAKSEHELDRGQCKHLAQQLCHGFAENGFIYINNHGIQEAQIQRMFATADTFFSLPSETKEKYKVKQGSNDKHGYVPINGELLGKDTKQEYRESFNISTTKSIELPEVDCPGFTVATESFYRTCSFLVLRLLRGIAITLQLDDEDYFTNIHLPMDITDNFTTLRLLNYPKVPMTALTDGHALLGAVRCGEHSDYGTLTLLFQDNSGGLEVKTRDGNYLHVVPIPGTVVVNVGDTLEHMTSGKFLAARHRVLLNSQSILERRRSIAFFAHPVHGVPVQCLTGPNETNPITSYDFVKKRFVDTYTI